jgi:hypothetical protein
VEGKLGRRPQLHTEMRYSVITASQPQELTDTRGMEIYFHQPALFRKMWKSGWIRPTVNKGKTVLWSYKNAELCVARLEAGELPE